MKRKKRGQVWVETVIYTLIGLALIGLVLAIITPKATNAQDRIVIMQTVESLSVFDEKINEVLDGGPGNVRSIPSYTLKRGELFIEPVADSLIFLISGLEEPYSEVGIPIKSGPVTIISGFDGDEGSVALIVNYTNVANISYDGGVDVKKFTIAATQYRFSIENTGGNVDIKEVS